MPFVVKKDKESGKYRLYNKDKKEFAKRSFLTKESATKMADHYHNFSQMRKSRAKAPVGEPLLKEEEEVTSD